jgi:hypothetical protein
MEQPQHHINLEKMKNCIEQLPIHYQIQIAILLINYKTVTMNENKNGFYINLSFLPVEIINTIGVFLRDNNLING